MRGAARQIQKRVRPETAAREEVLRQELLVSGDAAGLE